MLTGNISSPLPKVQNFADTLNNMMTFSWDSVFTSISTFPHPSPRYDIEVNRWGVARGTPPGRLLSGHCEGCWGRLLAADLWENLLAVNRCFHIPPNLQYLSSCKETPDTNQPDKDKSILMQRKKKRKNIDTFIGYFT